MHPDGVSLGYFKLIEYLIRQNYKFEISKVYDIGLQRYRYYIIRVCGKNSVPQQFLMSQTFNILNYEFWRIKYSISLKYQRFTPSGFQDIEIRKLEI